MPKADATGLAPEKSADHNSPAHDSSVRESLAFLFGSSLLLLSGATQLQPVRRVKIKPISLVKSLSGGLGPKTRRPPGKGGRAVRIPIFWLFCCSDTARAYTGEYPIPLACSVNTVGRSG